MDFNKIRREIRKVHGNDPYYTDILNARSQNELMKAVLALKNVRGQSAYDALVRLMRAAAGMS